MPLLPLSAARDPYETLRDKILILRCGQSAIRQVSTRMCRLPAGLGTVVSAGIAHLLSAQVSGSSALLSVISKRAMPPFSSSLGPPETALDVSATALLA